MRDWLNHIRDTDLGLGSGAPIPSATQNCIDISQMFETPVLGLGSGGSSSIGDLAQGRGRRAIYIYIYTWIYIYIYICMCIYIYIYVSIGDLAQGRGRRAGVRPPTRMTPSLRGGLCKTLTNNII